MVKADISADHIQKVYVWLMLLNTLAASFIWGVNTLFLLDAGLNNVEAFTANAFFTVGQVLFEIPTGVVADTWGRRTSYLLGTITLTTSTLLYLGGWYVHAPFWWWAVTSILLGLGFTFFSGATEAWLVDALKYVGYTGELESVFAKSQMATGVAMLIGSAGGGVIAQMTNLGVPYMIRAAALGLNFLIAFMFMRDLGFVPQRSTHIGRDVAQLFHASFKHGLGNPKVRWIMLTAPFTFGVSFYAMYALQPLLLSLYGDEGAYGIAGLAAAIVAGAQIIGGMVAPKLKQFVKDRTLVLGLHIAFSSGLLLTLGFVSSFWMAIAIVMVWGLLWAASSPIRQAYLNEQIPSKQRATVLSFDSTMGSVGGVIIQPVLGKAADLWSYSVSYIVSSGINLFALPFALLAKKADKE